MAILSKRMMSSVGKLYSEKYGVTPCFMDLSGKAVNTVDLLANLSGIRRKRDYGLQESITLGKPYVFTPVSGIGSFVVALENRRMIHGGLIGGEVLLSGASGKKKETLDYLVSYGMTYDDAEKFLVRLPVWPERHLREAGQFLQDTFYSVSGWKPELMNENRLKALQQEQIAQAIDDQKKQGKNALYAFEKERVLLTNIRAGDRNGARRVLNEMLAAIYLSSPRYAVLRARAIELMSCLTRAAIEDNPLMEPLIERNHAWTERLVRAGSFEDLSHVLMEALDDFIDGIYLHGVNRSNTKVRMALDYISGNYMKKISLRTIAGSVDLSACRLAHLVKEYTGKTVLQIIQQVRIRHAQQLLERTSRNCTDIAYEVGFQDQSYFIKHFKRLAGITPARYRRSMASGSPV
ncbi:MAG: AraC family transcriptional regulator [Kiritimatiellae bacterium]|nr:AraC family transcriptional regulator [Kiritimatiellia bacterium]MDD5520021.1 AraC family transcriptional regulator [Kiritimatiellia bacterium]